MQIPFPAMSVSTRAPNWPAHERNCAAASRHELRIKSVFERAAAGDGARILVERVWPHRLSMRRAALTSWLKELAPSAELTDWFGDDPARWTTFVQRYRLELAANRTGTDHLRKLLRSCPITLLHAAPDGQHTHARILADVILDAGSPGDAERPVGTGEGSALPADKALLETLNELVEAERAGARVTRRTADQVVRPDLKALIMAIHRDEARWCAVLAAAVIHLGGIPSSRTGPFLEKAMAIEDIGQRLVFLNRGQAWVAKRLRQLLPAIDEAHLHQQLEAMLDSHESNIERVADFQAQKPGC